MATPVRPLLFLGLFRERSVLTNWSLSWLELSRQSIIPAIQSGDGDGDGFLPPGPA